MNSSRSRRRSDFGEREYRAKSAPFTTSGRLVSAKTGPSRFVTYGARAARSSAVNDSTISLILPDRPEGGDDGDTRRHAHEQVHATAGQHEHRDGAPQPRLAGAGHELAPRGQDHRHRQRGQNGERDQAQPQAEPRWQRPTGQRQQQRRASEIGGKRHTGDGQRHARPHAVSSGSPNSAPAPLTVRPAMMMCQLPGSLTAMASAARALPTATSQSRRWRSWVATRARKTAGKAKSRP